MCRYAVGERNAKTDWWGYLKQRDHLEEMDVDRKIILKE
jgi:hypothetical protein